jgi:oligopeptide/dipeptide ABC transporter ATP-binding protein
MAGGAGWLRAALAQSTGKTLTVAIPNSPNTLDPINTVIHEPMVITYMIYENLVDMDVDGNLVPQLAKALPEISADKLIYTFDLREDVEFHNGQPMTAEDAKYSFESMLDVKRNAVRRGIFTKIEQVIVDSPHRVRVVLREPYSPWTSFLYKYMSIWPKGSRESLGDEHFRLHPTGVGTGPGIFEEWKPNESITLRRNPNYWQKDLPHWDKLVVRLIPQDPTRVAYLLTKQVDIIGAPPPRGYTRLSKQKGITGGVRSTLGGWSVLLMNNTIGRQLIDAVQAHQRIGHRGATDRAVELLSLVGIPAPRTRLTAFAHEFSGGMRQRVAIAIAIACQARLLIADEPTTALDVTVQGQVIGLLARLRAATGIAVLFISHNLDLVAEIFDRVAVMHAGHIVETNAVENMFATPRHPYTRQLLRCIPRLSDGAGALPTIRGEPPRFGPVQSGCPFAPRCDDAEPRCGVSMPPHIGTKAERVACWLAS